MPERLFLSWSSGKDSAWALAVLRADPAFEVAGLLTTLSARYDRVAMHGVRRELLEAQARAAGLALRTVELPSPCSNAQYEEAMRPAIAALAREGVSRLAFGDLFLADVRRYREALLAGSGVAPLFPLWGRDTRELAWQMIGAGLRARIVCVDPARLAQSWAGALWDEAFLRALPEGIDPCAENGEFHTFAFAGPMFAQPVPVRPGEIVRREGFVFADLLAG